jgi:hypothetical protein
MSRAVLVVLFSAVFTVARGATATQTDWSEGPGVLGPVTIWGSEFCLDTAVSWIDNAGFLSLSPAQYSVAIANAARCVYSEDIDGDGDMDVLAASDDDISWWENLDGLGTSWIEHSIRTGYLGACCVYSEDVDNDGDKDVLGTAFNDEIIWWENLTGSGTLWTEHYLDASFNSPYCVYAEDIDGDTDIDVLGSSWWRITWWENLDGSGTSWAAYTIDTDFDEAYSVHSEDIDGDGDMDVSGASADRDEIAWWENLDGSGLSWNKSIIDASFDGARSVYSSDVDGDGDIDVLGAGFSATEITWWENLDGSGVFWTEHIIDDNFFGARSVHSIDIDDDGDMDVLGAGTFADAITWWENLDGSGASWAEHIVDGRFDGAYSVHAEDVNGDSRIDVLGAAYTADEVTWWDLGKYGSEGSLESSILDTQTNPDWDYLEWNSQIPSGTSVVFQVRASDDHTAMGAWSDTLLAPCLLNGILSDGDRYLQYRAILETSDPDTSPTLNDLTFTWDPVSIVEEAEPTPPEPELLSVVPNPCRSATINFGLPEPAAAGLYVFDLSGRLLHGVSGGYQAGYQSILLGVLPPGVYFCRMTSGDFTATERFVVIE